MKLPFRVEEHAATALLLDDDGCTIASTGISVQGRQDLRTLARMVNAHHALVSVCRDAYILADDRTDTRPAPCEDIELLSLMVSAGAALELAKGEQ